MEVEMEKGKGSEKKRGAAKWSPQRETRRVEEWKRVGSDVIIREHLGFGGLLRQKEEELHRRSLLRSFRSITD